LKFISRKEIAFINSVNKELIQSVVGQTVYYYAILPERTKRNDLYNEAVTKVWAPPVRTNCLLYYENTQEQIGSLPPDAKFKIDVYFHTEELRDRGLMPKMGDFLQFGDIVFEIYQVTQPQIIYGMIEQKIMTRASAGPARQGQFDPVKQPMPVTRHDMGAPMYPEQPPQRAYTADMRAKSTSVSAPAKNPGTLLDYQLPFDLE
jgi:hypothetical protein